MSSSSRGANGNQGSKWIRKDKRLAIYLRDGFRCVYCQQDLTRCAARFVTLDHLKPRSEGGSNEAKNLVTCCLTCNSARGNISWTHWAGEANVPRINALRTKDLNRSLAKAVLADEVDREVALAEAKR